MSSRFMLLQITQIAYWLALSTWFGGVLFIAIAAPIIFRTVRDANPVMTDVLSVNLEGQHATLLAGSIVSNLLARVGRIEMICAAVVLLALIPQFFTDDWRLATIRAMLCLIAAGFVVFDYFVVGPKIRAHRAAFIAHADEPEAANPEKEKFDNEHRRSVTILMFTLAVLLLLVMQSVPGTKTMTPISSAPGQGK